MANVPPRHQSRVGIQSERGDGPYQSAGFLLYGSDQSHRRSLDLHAGGSASVVFHMPKVHSLSALQDMAYAAGRIEVHNRTFDEDCFVPFHLD